jgi:hypothetical protein
MSRCRRFGLGLSKTRGLILPDLSVVLREHVDQIEKEQQCDHVDDCGFHFVLLKVVAKSAREARSPQKSQWQAISIFADC